MEEGVLCWLGGMLTFRYEMKSVLVEQQPQNDVLLEPQGLEKGKINNLPLHDYRITSSTPTKLEAVASALPNEFTSDTATSVSPVITTGTNDNDTDLIQSTIATPIREISSSNVTIVSHFTSSELLWKLLSSCRYVSSSTN